VRILYYKRFSLYRDAIAAIREHNGTMNPFYRKPLGIKTGHLVTTRKEVRGWKSFEALGGSDPTDNRIRKILR